MTRLIAFAALRPDVARALRASVAFAIPLIICRMLGWGADGVFVAMAAQAIALPDLRGSYRMRLAILILMTMIAAGSVMLGVCAGSSITASVLAMGLIALLGGCWRHVSSDYGPAASVASALLFLLGLAHPGSGGSAWHLGGLIVLGGMGTALLSLVLWPFRPEYPMRFLVAESWTAVSDLAASMRPDLTGENAVPDAVVAHHERELRASLDRAFIILSAAHLRRPSAFVATMEEMRRHAVQFGMRLVALHSSCDALARLPEFAGIRPVIDSALKSLGDTARSAAVTLISHQPGNFALTEVRLRRSQHLLQVLDSQLVEASGGAEREHLRAAIPPLVEVLERLRGTLGETVEKGSSGFTFPAIPPDIQGRSVRSLAAWINPSPAVYSVLIRYSLRMALLTMVAVGCYKVFAIPNGYWIAFTIVVVLQPDYGSTRQRAAERMGGTLAGSLLGSALLWVKMPSALLLACAVGMAFAFAYFLKRRYWFAVFFVTLMLVLITETMGEVHLDFTIVRTLSNLLGGAVALLAAFAFWPASEEKSFHALLAAAIRANASYARAMVALLGTANAAPAEVLMMKRRAENAEGLVAASLQRLLTEPRGHWEDASSLATYNQRITRAFTVMTVHLLHGARQEANETRAAINHVGDILEALASTIEVGWTAAPAANLDAHLKTMDDLLSRARTAASNASPESQLVLAHLTKGAVEIRAMALALHPGGSHEESGDTRMVPASA